MSVNTPLNDNYKENECSVIYQRNMASSNEFNPSEMTQYRFFMDNLLPGRHTIFADLRAQLKNVDVNESSRDSERSLDSGGTKKEQTYSILAKSLTRFYYEIKPY